MRGIGNAGMRKMKDQGTRDEMDREIEHTGIRKMQGGTGTTTDEKEEKDAKHMIRKEQGIQKKEGKTQRHEKHRRQKDGWKY